jgi:hypothetical protein
MRSRALRWIYPDVPAPTKFTAGVARELLPREPDVVAEILDEATELFRVPYERADSAERRATTLQGAVAIAATFTLAAGTLVTDADKVGSHAWRVVFAVAIAFVVLAFVIAGVVALQATSRIDAWRYPDERERFLQMKTQGVEDIRAARALALLQAYGENDQLAGWKIRRTTLAARWFRIALLLLLAFAGLFVIYVAQL